MNKKIKIDFVSRKNQINNPMNTSWEKRGE